MFSHTVFYHIPWLVFSFHINSHSVIYSIAVSHTVLQLLIASLPFPLSSFLPVISCLFLLTDTCIPLSFTCLLQSPPPPPAVSLYLNHFFYSVVLSAYRKCMRLKSLPSRKSKGLLPLTSMDSDFTPDYLMGRCISLSAGKDNVLIFSNLQNGTLASDLNEFHRIKIQLQKPT